MCKAGPVKELLERERELAVVEKLLGHRSGALAIEVGIGSARLRWFRQLADERKSLVMRS